ncbi:hypothetical protein [Streptomyces flaveolus]|uniref:hypothetical protein n=1 Tax=Streptomyces flaveolus TaxID=67297 RepID=UPI00340E775B
MASELAVRYEVTVLVAAINEWLGSARFARGNAELDAHAVQELLEQILHERVGPLRQDIGDRLGNGSQASRPCPGHSTLRGLLRPQEPVVDGLAILRLVGGHSCPIKTCAPGFLVPRPAFQDKAVAVHDESGKDRVPSDVNQFDQTLLIE